MSGIDIAGLRLSVQEDDCRNLSTFFCTLCCGLGNFANLTSPSRWFGYCMCSPHAHVFTTAGLPFRSSEDSERLTLSDLWAEGMSCLCVLSG